jgi:hypothetical protein
VLLARAAGELNPPLSIGENNRPIAIVFGRPNARPTLLISVYLQHSAWRPNDRAGHFGGSLAAVHTYSLSNGCINYIIYAVYRTNATGQVDKKTSVHYPGTRTTESSTR